MVIRWQQDITWRNEDSFYDYWSFGGTFWKNDSHQRKGTHVPWHENTLHQVANCCAKYEELSRGGNQGVFYEFYAEGSYTSEADAVWDGGPERGGRQTFPRNSGQAAQFLYMGKSRHSFAGQIPMYQGIKITEQDQARLKWVLEYVSGTINLEYILGSNSLNKLWTWVDA